MLLILFIKSQCKCKLTKINIKQASHLHDSKSIIESPQKWEGEIRTYNWIAFVHKRADCIDIEQASHDSISIMSLAPYRSSDVSFEQVLRNVDLKNPVLVIGLDTAPLGVQTSVDNTFMPLRGTTRTW